MYSTCLFCNNALGRNESIEQFPVGRRLAFDAARGRLWVVCPSCARWNLSPLETRWEAIEEAERAYRDSRIRVATEQIGMAKLRDGLELVRIGSPLRPEFATWRYGDIVRRRRRRAMLGVVGAAAPLTVVAVVVTGSALAAGALAGGLILAGQIANLTSVIAAKRNPANQWVNLTVNNGRRVRLDRMEAATSQIILAPDTSNWILRVSHLSNRINGPPERTKDGGFSKGPATHYSSELTGDLAMAALATLIPSVNKNGATRATLDDAVALVSSEPDFHALLSGRTPNKSSPVVHSGLNTLNKLPSAFRLALEMTLHEGDERRAMDGELRRLADRWREAEEVAAISDALMVPAAVNQKLNVFKRERQ